LRFTIALLDLPQNRNMVDSTVSGICRTEIVMATANEKLPISRKRIQNSSKFILADGHDSDIDDRLRTQ